MSNKAISNDNEMPEGPDQGASLILALVMMIITAMIVLPTLSYTMAVTRHSRIAMTRTSGDEQVKGGLRTALADPGKLYLACSGGQRTDIHTIASGLNGVSTTCQWLSDRNERDASTISYSVATTQAGSTVPPDAVPQTAPASWYAMSGNTDPTAWIADSTKLSAADKIWAPLLPAHALSHPSLTGYDMPAGFTPCTVFFPGTYNFPVVISANKPTFFTSGIYYFTDTVTINGDANVVVGDGGIEGCTTDQEAAFSAIGAPTSHNITGVGATFLFGGAGRLIINDSGAGADVSVRFNKRYVGGTDVSTISSAGVSIMTVNGKLNPTGTAIDPLDLTDPLVRPTGQLYVPAPLVQGATESPATPANFLPSTVISSGDPLLPAFPMVDVSLSTSKPVTVEIPGYVAVPQGTINVTTTPAGTANKDVQITGGILAAQVLLTAARPSTFVFGAVNAVVQKTLKIETVTANSRSRSVAIVQVNSIGTYYVNSWEVQAS
jgi:hypothetical protein